MRLCAHTPIPRWPAPSPKDASLCISLRSLPREDSEKQHELDTQVERGMAPVKDDV